MKRVEIKFTATVDDNAVEELSRIVDHHLDWLIDLQEFPEINGLSDAELKEID